MMKKLINGVGLLLIVSCVGAGMYVKLDTASGLGQHVDRQVELTGRVSEVIWQHLGAYFPDYPESYYFDVGDFQIVVYARAPIECAGELTVRGRVVELRGPSKRPGDTEESKVDDRYVEYHLKVDSWECGPSD